MGGSLGFFFSSLKFFFLRVSFFPSKLLFSSLHVKLFLIIEMPQKKFLSIFFIDAVVCMYFLFVLCMLLNESLVDQPQAEGIFPVQIIIFLYLSVIQKSLTVQEGGLFYLQLNFIEIPQIGIYQY